MSNAFSFDDLAGPKVGIFWLMPDLFGILYGSSLTVAEGELYGDYRIFPESHFDHLECLNAKRLLEDAGLARVLRDDYSAVSRGRVSFYHGRIAGAGAPAPYSSSVRTKLARKQMRT